MCRPGGEILKYSAVRPLCRENPTGPRRRRIRRKSMFRLTRDVRFAVHPHSLAAGAVEGRNGFAGKPPITGLGQPYYRLSVTVAGPLQPNTGYLLNIRTIDEAVRTAVIPLVSSAVRHGGGDGGGIVIKDCFQALAGALAPTRVEAMELHLSPFTSLSTSADPAGGGDGQMVFLHHTFEFAASHRLHNPAFSDEQNREIFGKCNNPHGHGHNYVLRVTLRGRPDGEGRLISIEDLERIVDDEVIEPFDHRHLNVEVAEFGDLNPSVENIARVIFERLRKPLETAGSRLHAVTVWETPKTSAEYRGGAD